MTRARPDEVVFGRDEPDEVVAGMARLTEAGRGWVNIRPVIDEADEPPPPGLLAIFGGSVHKVPTATWMPGRPGRDGSTGPATIGLQHAAGSHVSRWLRDQGHPLPAGWRVTQDHPRRGLVAHVAPGTGEAEVLDWLVRAAALVCAVPATGRWRAAFHAGLA